MNDAIKDKPFALVGVLAGVCAIAGLALGLIYLSTSDRIKAEEENAKRAALVVVHPDAKAFEEVKADDQANGQQFIYYKAYDKPLDDETKQCIGYACEGRAQGYSSTLIVIVGLDVEAETITGIKITQQQETAGLGANCEAVTSEQYIWDIFSNKSAGGPAEPEFQAQFRNRQVEDLVPEGKSYKGVKALTGATITTNAVVRATLNAAEKFGKVDAVSSATKNDGTHAEHPANGDQTKEQRPEDDEQ